jgi:hypothetical protein
MADNFTIDKDLMKASSDLLAILLGDLKHVDEGEDEAILMSVGYKGIFTTRELMYAPMTTAIFEMMGQNGVRNLMFRGGVYAGKKFAIDTIESGMAKWDESILNHHALTHTATGYGYASYSEINLDVENPRLVCYCKNHPNATTVPEIMEDATKENSSLSIDYTQTFCDHHTGFMLGVAKELFKNIGASDDVISKLKGKEEYCQAQEGNDHCKHIVGLLEL